MICPNCGREMDVAMVDLYTGPIYINTCIDCGTIAGNDEKSEAEDE